MCSIILKESIAHYINNGSTMLDATKAFDRVKYFKLFMLLNERGLSPVIIRLTCHLVRISWNGVYSSSFPVKNGVKQSAMISSVLLCCYIDKLFF